MNVTVVPQTTLGFLTIWPSGEGQPTVSTLNSLDGRIKANAAIIPAGTPSGSVSVFVTNTTNVVLDINGYFTAAGGSTLEFYPVAPCRVADTRHPNGPLGGPSLTGGHGARLPGAAKHVWIAERRGRLFLQLHRNSQDQQRRGVSDGVATGTTCVRRFPHSMT